MQNFHSDEALPCITIEFPFSTCMSATLVTTFPNILADIAQKVVTTTLTVMLIL